MGNWFSHNWLSQRKRKRAEVESTEEASSSSSKRPKEDNTEGASTSSSISQEATAVGSGQYDVFLSFRGQDTRKGFADHLYHSLEKAGIRMFKDDRSIPIGERFDLQIRNAITQCKISIPIISENYASSKWCLRELSHMMKRKESSAHTILPIFYKVSPSDVRHLKQNFEEAFSSGQKHLDEKDIQEGRRALEEVGKLEGWESEKFANGHEGQLIKRVVETVRSKLRKYFQLDVPEELVGLDDHLEKIMKVIDSRSVNARMIGIYGMGGIGKTTLAKCIFDQLSNKFDRVSFLPDVRETTKRLGVTHLQKNLIKDILDDESDVSRPFEGINIIKSGFRGIKVLIFLDDVDDQEQLDALARKPDWFGEGSLIIVTTRNKAVLKQSKFEVDYKYKLEGLDEKRSLLLFNRHAFRKDRSPLDFASISCDIISTMGGLPLALEVVGAYLYKRDRKVWEETWKILESQPFESQPYDKVQEKLRISYDALKKEHKQIFLDIACFSFTKYEDESEIAMCMWEGCGFHPIGAIEELKSRCLIKIGDYGRFEMHDQLRELGRSIFCKEQRLENHCGPWDADYEGVPRVLSQHGERFDDLLRAALSGDERFSEVRWLEWGILESHLSLSTTNLHLPKLAVLDLADSFVTEDWEGWSSIKASTRLRFLNLCGCDNLRSSPDLSTFTQLKMLSLAGCSKLEHLHPSIAGLKSLVSLLLSYCTSLKELPEEVGELRDLEELHLRSSGIAQIPTCIRFLGKLKKLDASRCESLRGIPSSIGDLQNLQHLCIREIAIEEVPGDIGRLKNLETLDVSETPISDLPEGIRNLSSLQHLNLRGCHKLRSLPELPSCLTNLSVPNQSLRLPQLSSLIHLEVLHLFEDVPELPSRLLKLDGFRYLESFSITSCSSIERLDISELVHLKRLSVCQCNNLVEIQGLDNLEFLEYIAIWNCNSIESLLGLKSECLKDLSVYICDNLVKIQVPLDGVKFLERLSIEKCKSLEALPDLTGCEKLRVLIIQDCEKLTQLRGTQKLNLSLWDISGCDSLKAIPKLSGKRFR